MPDVFIGLKEAAEFEGVKYNTLVQRIKRSPNQYKTRTQPQENGGREQVLVSVDSLTAKGRKAWRAAQKIDGRDVVIVLRIKIEFTELLRAILNNMTLTHSTGAWLDINPGPL